MTYGIGLTLSWAASIGYTCLWSFSFYLNQRGFQKINNVAGIIVGRQKNTGGLLTKSCKHTALQTNLKLWSTIMCFAAVTYYVHIDKLTLQVSCSHEHIAFRFFCLLWDSLHETVFSSCLLIKCFVVLVWFLYFCTCWIRLNACLSQMAQVLLAEIDPQKCLLSRSCICLRWIHAAVNAIVSSLLFKQTWYSNCTLIR